MWPSWSALRDALVDAACLRGQRLRAADRLDVGLLVAATGVHKPEGERGIGGMHC